MSSALLRAIQGGDARAVAAAARRDPAAASHPRAICDAARLADAAVLKSLVSAGADPNASWRGYRPLHSVIQEDPHACGASRATPGRLAAIRVLLDAGADPELPAAWPPARAILVAAFVGEPVFVELLEAAGARTDTIFAGAALGRASTVRSTLRRDPAMARARDEGGLTALQCAAASRLGSADAGVAKDLLRIATMLLDSGAEPNALTRSWSHDVDACHFAATSGNAEVFRLLLDRGADATAALPSAVWSCRYEMAEAALAHGARPDRAASNGKPLLNDLIRWGQVAPALWLLGKGASPDVADAGGFTAVHQAASRGNARLLRAVLDAGGDRSRRDRDGRTAADVARRLGRSALLPLLAAPGAASSRRLAPRRGRTTAGR